MADGSDHPKDTPADLQVRVGTLADLDEVMHIAMLGCEENGFLAANQARILQHIYGALIGQGAIIGVIGKPGGTAEGAVLLEISPMWYSDPESLVVEERAIFIHPQYRSAKGGRARKLCEFSKQVADKLGLPLVIGILSNARTQAKVRLYHRVFGEPAGAFFLYNAHTGAQPPIEAE